MEVSQNWVLAFGISTADELTLARKEYSTLRRKYIVIPQSESNISNNDKLKGITPKKMSQVDNPLSLDTESTWSKYFNEQVLRQEILQDVIRTFPSISLFREEYVQEPMVTILTVWSKMYPLISYRQGMHDILAPVYKVFLESAIADNNGITKLSEDTLSTVEKTVAVVFLNIMNSAKYLFVNNLEDKLINNSDLFLFDGIPEKDATLLASKNTFHTIGSSSLKDKLPMLRICNRIQNVYLRTVDPELQTQLAHSKIEPQFYMMRWLRVLFSREFRVHNNTGDDTDDDNLESLNLLWTAIFNYRDPIIHMKYYQNTSLSKLPFTLKLAEWICVAMLVLVRNVLIEKDTDTILMALMRFPSLDYAHIIAANPNMDPDDLISSYSKNEHEAIKKSGKGPKYIVALALSLKEKYDEFKFPDLFSKCHKVGLSDLLSGLDISKLKINESKSVSKIAQINNDNPAFESSMKSPTQNTIGFRPKTSTIPWNMKIDFNSKPSHNIPKSDDSLKVEEPKHISSTHRISISDQIPIDGTIVSGGSSSTALPIDYKTSTPSFDSVDHMTLIKEETIDSINILNNLLKGLKFDESQSSCDKYIYTSTSPDLVHELQKSFNHLTKILGITKELELTKESNQKPRVTGSSPIASSSVAKDQIQDIVKLGITSINKFVGNIANINKVSHSSSGDEQLTQVDVGYSEMRQRAAQRARMRYEKGLQNMNKSAPGNSEVKNVSDNANPSNSSKKRGTIDPLTEKSFE